VQDHAGVAQLVERNLAKVEVASSSLVSRSNKKGKPSFPFCLVALINVLDELVLPGTERFMKSPLLAR
jgi:hypothetical protein